MTDGCQQTGRWNGRSQPFCTARVKVEPSALGPLGNPPSASPVLWQVWWAIIGGRRHLQTKSLLEGTQRTCAVGDGSFNSLLKWEKSYCSHISQFFPQRISVNMSSCQDYRFGFEAFLKFRNLYLPYWAQKSTCESNAFVKDKIVYTDEDNKTCFWSQEEALRADLIFLRHHILLHLKSTRGAVAMPMGNTWGPRWDQHADQTPVSTKPGHLNITFCVHM